MGKQDFKKTTLHFNLRTPNREEKASVIYAVVRHERIQLKLNTDVKVLPRYWNRRYEVCLRSPMIISPTHNENNRIANERIMRIREGFSKSKDYLCQNPFPISQREMRRLIFNHAGIIMTETRKKKGEDEANATRQLEIAVKNLAKRYPDSAGTYRSQLNQFIKFIKEKGINDRVEDVCTQETIDAYQRYLLSKKITDGYTNKLCQMVVRLINENPKQLKCEEIRYKGLKTKLEHSDGKKKALTDEEVKLLENVELDKEREKEARDIFLLEVYTGQRIGDLPKIFKGGQTQVKNGYEFLPIMTQKENELY